MLRKSQCDNFSENKSIFLKGISVVKQTFSSSCLIKELVIFVSLILINTPFWDYIKIFLSRLPFTD